MSSSMRLRLQLWYALVLVAVIGGLAAALYLQVRFNQLRAIDARLDSAAAYLQATLRGLPPHELDPNARPPRFPFGPGGPSPGDGTPGETLRARPRGPVPWRPDAPAAERLRAAIELPASLFDARPFDPEHESPHFVIWRSDGSVLAESDPARAAAESQPVPRGEPRRTRAGGPPGFRWRDGEVRQRITAGPHGTLILVARPVGRELAELRWFAGRLAASGLVLLAIGLAGGWLISRTITRPIAAIAATASEISDRNLARRIELSGLDEELVGLARVLNDMFARLESSFERQSRFTSDASHELRTPLAVIHAHAELALSRERSAEEYRETLAACLKAAGRMSSLVDGLLMLARADAGRLDPQFRQLDWRAIVAEVVDQYQPQAAAAGIELTADLPDAVAVRGDGALLARVSGNLLSNALRYTPSGGKVRVALAARGHDGAVLAIEDTGVGIPLEDQGKVFERFFRTDKARTRAQGGNGLGLAICKSLVEAHHGTIAFESSPDRGSRFEVCLPLAVANGEDGGVAT